MGLRFDPIGGGQLKQAVKQIMEAESQPLKTLEARKAREQARLKLFQDFKGKFGAAEKALDELSSFKKFRELKVDLGDGASQMAMTVDKDKASPGSFELQIDELAARTSVISNGFDNPDEANLGMGFIVLEMPDGDSKEIFVEEGDSSLHGIARLINNQADFPVRASVVRDASDPDSPWRLIMTGKKDGAEQELTFPDFYFLDGAQDFYISDTHNAQNALIKVDGFPIELNSNNVEDFLPGVNLHLKQAKEGQPFTVTITEDFQKIAGKVKSFVEKTNEILEFINKQNQIDDKSDTRSTFAGDTGLQTVEFRLRNMMHEGFPVWEPGSDEPKVFNLSQLGVEFDKSGQLAFKEDKFTKFMEKNFDTLSQIFTGDMGFAFQMRQVLDGYSTPGVGMLSIREQSMRGRIKNIDDQIDQKNRQLERRQQSLTEQFSRLQASLGAMQQQQQYLAASLPGAGGGNLISQLLGG